MTRVLMLVCLLSLSFSCGGKGGGTTATAPVIAPVTPVATVDATLRAKVNGNTYGYVDANNDALVIKFNETTYESYSIKDSTKTIEKSTGGYSFDNDGNIIIDRYAGACDEAEVNTVEFAYIDKKILFGIPNTNTTIYLVEVDNLNFEGLTEGCIL